MFGPSVRHSHDDAKDFVKRCVYLRIFRQRRYCGIDVRRFYLEECTGCTGGHGKDVYVRDGRDDGRNSVSYYAIMTDATNL